MNDNVISLEKRRQDKASAGTATVTLSPGEAAIQAAVVAARAAVDQEHRCQMHMVLVNATTKVLGARPLSTKNRLEIARNVVQVLMGHGWSVVRK